MDQSKLKYVYLIILSLIWGSSFILIKKALGVGEEELILQPLQLGAMRTIISGVILIAIGWKSFITTDKAKWKWLAVSGFLGTFFPAFLFAYAQTEIDSAISAILNSTVPLISLIMGAIIFGIAFTRNQLIGVIIGLAGGIGLVIAGMKSHPDQNYLFAGLVFIACICYASNVNIIKKYLQNVQPLAIATGNFIFIVPFAFVVFFASDGATIEFATSRVQESFIYIIILCIFGTVTAKIMFNKLVQISNPVFASSVTYLMPIISVMWGLLDHGNFSIWQLFASLIIMVGVYLVNKKTKTS